MATKSREVTEREQGPRTLRGIEGFLSFLRKLRRTVAADGLTEVMDELDREEQEGEHPAKSKRPRHPGKRIATV